MKTKVRKLSIVDIITNKKDLLWGKEYFGQFQKSKLVNYLVFGKYLGIRNIIEIYDTDTCSRDLIDDFVNYYSKKTKYFVRELDELRDFKAIEVMREAGFLRYNRNYCFDFHAQNSQVSKDKVNNVYCRGIERADFSSIADFDRDCQILEYRDLLYRNKSFFKNHVDDVFIFTQTQNLSNTVAYAIKRDVKDKSVFEIILNPNQSELIHDCIQAFAETYVFFENFDDNFYFIVNENLKNEIEQLKKTYEMVWSSQMLIKEGNPKVKTGLAQRGLNLAMKKTT